MEGPPNAFSKLPYEIRQTVYQYLLSTRRTKRITSYQGMGYYDLQPAIFRTCRRIYDEARPVLYRANSFVRVVCDKSKLQASITRFGVPTLNMRHRSQVYSLGMSISTSQPASRDLYHFIIASEDLPTLCDLLWLPSVRGAARFTVHFYLCASFFTAPHAISLRKILLASFRNLWRAKRVSIYGAYDDNLPAELQANILDLANMSPTDAVDFVQSLKMEGLQFSGDSEYPRAAIAYNKAFRAAWIVRCSHFRGIPANLEEPSDESRLWCTLLAVAFQAAAGLSVACVEMKEWRNALWACTEALKIPDVNYWRPDIAISDDTIASVKEIGTLLKLKLGSLARRI